MSDDKTKNTVADPRAAPKQAPAAGGVAKVPPAPRKLSVKEKMARFWRYAVVTAWVLLGAALGWGIATIQGRLAVQEARRKFEEEKVALVEEAAQGATHERALLARRSIHQALVALDQRNFGTAEELARGAGEQLASLGEAGAEYSEIAKQLSNFRPTVSDDTSQQSRDLLGMAQRFDQVWDDKHEL